MTRHADAMDAVNYWRQFVTAFYFDRPGDTVEGTVVELVNARRDEPPAIKIQTRDGRLYVVTARQARLAFELVKAAPAIGDGVTIRYDGDATKAAPGMTKAKEFTVTVRRAGSRPPNGTGGSPARGSVGGPPENVPGAGK